MPPPQRVRQLTGREIALLTKWIEEGATWKQHWSFIPPVRPTPPDSKFRAAASNAVDRFVFARLEQERLWPSPPVRKETLLRRVTLDLTGLPPTPEEVAAFAGNDSPDAYERAVDRLLASPRYGERMAVMWLDAARFADTSGYQTDGERHMWRWRDWVIDAFNRNQPFDQFTIEQIAGDLLPNPTLDQTIATGFNRNHRANSEGGIVFEEYLVEYAADRVDATATVWLGLTAGCARCHDHKYDPITQEEFYQLFAYFNRLDELGRVFKYGNSPPLAKAPTEAMQEELARLDAHLAAARDAWAALERDVEQSQVEWERRLAEKDAQSLAAINPQWTIEGELAASFPFNGDGANAVSGAAAATFEGKPPQFAPGMIGECASLDGSQFLAAELGFALTDLAPFTLSAWVFLDDSADATVLSLMNDKDTRDGGLSLHVRDGRLQLNMGPRWLDDALRVETEHRFETGRWLHVAATYDASRVAKGLKLYVDGEVQPVRVGVDLLTGGLTAPTMVRLGSRGFEGHLAGKLDDVRIYRRCLSPQETAALSCADAISDIAALPHQQRTAPQTEKLRAYYLAAHADEPVRTALAQLQSADEERRRYWDSIPTVMVMHDSVPRETYILTRGEYDKPGRRVEPGVPASLPPLPADAPRNRLALAQWLVDPDNPLTARVAVNRVWAMFFGEGLVRTTEDFGAQGAPPTHPELLDWLAVDFVESGWDVKRLVRTIVASSVYRQSSRVTGEQEARDPANRLLSRAPRLRFPAEIARDQALAASGLLHAPIGGPSVKPYQPPGLWEELSTLTFQQDEGSSLYRRSLYTFWKRTVPPPGLAAFDAPSREACTVRRSRTNTPLQALSLMNEEIFVQAARGLAERMLLEADGDAAQRLAHGFQLLLGRAPTPQETETLVANFERNMRRFQSDAAAAQAFITEAESTPRGEFNPVELAAYTLTASLLLNLDEAITRE
jgi:hypothetical protein